LHFDRAYISFVYDGLVLWISDLLLPFEDLRRKGLLSDVEKDIPGMIYPAK